MGQEISFFLSFFLFLNLGLLSGSFWQKVHFLVKWTPEISPVTSPDSDKNLKIVKKYRQNVYEVHQCNFEGLFINLGLLGRSFCQKVHFLVKWTPEISLVVSHDTDKIDFF